MGDATSAVADEQGVEIAGVVLLQHVEIGRDDEGRAATAGRHQKPSAFNSRAGNGFAATRLMPISAHSEILLPWSGPSSEQETVSGTVTSKPQPRPFTQP